MQCIVIGPVCVFACLQRAGGPAVSEHRETQTLRALAVVSYSQRARSVCVSLSAFSLIMCSYLIRRTVQVAPR